MRVLEIISDTNVGGAGKLLLSRMRHSDRRRWKTTVLLPYGSRLKPHFTELGIPVLEMKGCRDRSLDLLGLWELVRVIRSLRPTIVNCHGCVTARIAAAIAAVPIRVYTRHCVFPLSCMDKVPPIRLFQNIAFHILSHHVIAVANAAKSDLIQMGIPNQKITVIINGADALPRLSEKEKSEWRRALRIPDDAFVVGISARLEACKDHRTLLHAARRLKQSGLPCFFLILGEGSLRESLEAESVRLGISDCVCFVGFAENVSPYVNVMDVHVNCSVGTETSSLAISEAMSLGIPTVASNYGGNPYMVRDGVNGLLFPVRDDRALFACLHRLALSPSLYRKLSENSRLRFETELNAAAMTKKTERLYARLIRGRMRRLKARVGHKQN